MDGWMMGGYCIVCVMGPHKIFGPRAPQSLNPALYTTGSHYIIQ